VRATSPGGKLAAALAALFLLLAGCTSSSSGTQPAT
jgi:hypothetical protein